MKLNKEMNPPADHGALDEVHARFREVVLTMIPILDECQKLWMANAPSGYTIKEWETFCEDILIDGLEGFGKHFVMHAVYMDETQSSTLSFTPKSLSAEIVLVTIQAYKPNGPF